MSKLRSLVLVGWPNFGTETGFERWIQASIAIAESLDVYDHNLTTCPGMANLITSGNSPETDRRPLSGSIGSLLMQSDVDRDTPRDRTRCCRHQNSTGSWLRNWRGRTTRASCQDAQRCHRNNHDRTE